MSYKSRLDAVTFHRVQFPDSYPSETSAGKMK
jgi:hypothetical protein